jgi:hypothetical protein
MSKKLTTCIHCKRSVFYRWIDGRGYVWDLAHLPDTLICVARPGEQRHVPSRTDQQQAIVDKATALLATLDEVVPTNVGHYAVEAARKAMDTLIGTAASISTPDWQRPEEKA